VPKGNSTARKLVHFDPRGPFPLKRDTNRQGRSISAVSIEKFWAIPKVAHLKSKIGCYVFVIGKKPFYVGKATRSFGGEVFNNKNLATYRETVTKFRGRTSLYFIVYRKEASQRGKAPTRTISKVEKLLIGMAHEANPELTNVQHKNRPIRYCIAGVFNSGRGKPSESANGVRKILRLEKK
jgi:hypothetical protein